MLTDRSLECSSCLHMAAHAAHDGDHGRVRGESGDIVTSALGTKHHWDDVYEKELANFREHGDEGEVWFGYPVVRKMVSWCVAGPPGTDGARGAADGAAGAGWRSHQGVAPTHASSRSAAVTVLF